MINNESSMRNSDENMQIIQYIWVEKYKCLEDFETNFSTRVAFHYDKENNMIECQQENDDYIEGFAGDRIQLSCLVGRNGAGKTTILRFLKEILSTEYGGVSYNCIVIVFDGHKYTGWYYLSANLPANNKEYHYINTNCPFLTLYNHEDTVRKETKRLQSRLKTKPICHFGLKSARYIFCSNSLSSSFYKQPMGQDELSPSFAIFKNREPDNGIRKDPVNEYFLNQFNLQMRLILDLDDSLEAFSINYPYYVIGSLIFEKEHFEKWVDDYTQNSGKEERIRQDQLFESFLHFRTDEPMNSFWDQFAISIFYSIAYEISHTYNRYDNEEYLKFLKHIEECTQNGAFENVFRFLSDDQFWEEKANAMLFINRRKYYDFLVYFKELTELNRTDDYPLYVPMLDGTVSFVIPVKKEYATKAAFFPRGYIHTDIYDFFKKYREVASFHSFIHFSWGLSDGEQALLDLFSRLYSLAKYDKTNMRYYLAENNNDSDYERNAILLLDEIDNSLHPEWQRKIIAALVAFINKVYQGTSIQIILTTHSPIMLSDIPRQDTAFLKKDSKTRRTISVDSEETFAANIFSLFRNAFFLGESGIGSFAEDKLCRLITMIKNLYSNDGKTGVSIDEKKREIEKLIRCIGDPYIQHKFGLEYMSVIENAEGRKSALEKTIVAMEERLQHLKEQQKKLGE